jgi:hypothetical protein
VTKAIIVTRHEPAERFVREAAGLGPEVPCLAQVEPEEVQGNVVFGNLPMGLAALAQEVVAIEFSGDPPRGREYTLEDMVEAGAHLMSYQVHRLGESPVTPSEETIEEVLREQSS